MSKLKKEINHTVEALFANGKTPLEHCGIDGEKIGKIEQEHPDVAKQYPMSKCLS